MIFVLKRNDIIVFCLTICSIYQYMVDYPCGSLNLLLVLKTLLVLSK